MSGSEDSWKSSEALAEAKRRKLEVRKCAPHELQLDLDDYEYVRFAARVKKFKKVLDQFPYEIYITHTLLTRSPGGNVHCTLALNRRVTATMRVAFQACLGSDPTRELLSLLRIAHRDKTPTLLFEKPGTLAVDSPHELPPKEEHGTSDTND